MKTYTIFYSSGATQLIIGNTILDAMDKSNLGSDNTSESFYVEGDQRDKYEWDFKTGKWNKKENV